MLRLITYLAKVGSKVVGKIAGARGLYKVSYTAAAAGFRKLMANPIAKKIPWLAENIALFVAFDWAVSKIFPLGGESSVAEVNTTFQNIFLPDVVQVALVTESIDHEIPIRVLKNLGATLLPSPIPEVRMRGLVYLAASDYKASAHGSLIYSRDEAVEKLLDLASSVEGKDLGLSRSDVKEFADSVDDAGSPSLPVLLDYLAFVSDTCKHLFKSQTN